MDEGRNGENYEMLRKTSIIIVKIRLKGICGFRKSEDPPFLKRLKIDDLF